MSHDNQLSLIGGDGKFQFPAREIWRENGTSEQYADWWAAQSAKHGLKEGADFFRKNLKNKPGRGRSAIEHLLTAKAADILRTHSTAAGPQHTAAKHDALQSIADRLAAGKLPTSLEIARGLVTALEKIEEDRPKVELHDRYMAANGTHRIRDVAKMLGIPERLFIDYLIKADIIYRDSAKDLRPFAEHVKAGRFELKTGEANGQAYAQTRFTPAGFGWILDRLRVLPLTVDVGAK